MSAASITNRQIAELMALRSPEETGNAQRAFRRASRKAFLWKREAAEMAAAGESLRELEGIGPFLARQLHEWFDDPPPLTAPPDIRTGFLTATEAAETIQQRGPLEVKGDLQMHSFWSDGYSQIAEHAAEADGRGYEYIAITDHSKGLKIAKGIDEEQLLRQRREIDAVNADLESRGSGLRVLQSLEMNITPSGEGDMDPDALAALDIVLGSFHSNLRKAEDQTDRYIAALDNPDIQVLGHPRGRIYNFRIGLTADWDRVFAAAAERMKAVEIDSFPDRQDLDVALLRKARDAGVMISIGTDAHHHSQLWFIEFGVAAALAAGIDPTRILNLMSRSELLEWVAQVRDRSRVSSG